MELQPSCGVGPAAAWATVALSSLLVIGLLVWDPEAGMHAFGLSLILMAAMPVAMLAQVLTGPHGLTRWLAGAAIIVGGLLLVLTLEGSGVAAAAGLVLGSAGAALDAARRRGPRAWLAAAAWTAGWSAFSITAVLAALTPTCGGATCAEAVWMGGAALLCFVSAILGWATPPGGRAMSALV